MCIVVGPIADSVKRDSMFRLRVLLRMVLVVALAGNLSGCLLFMGTVDAYVHVEGELMNASEDCRIRFYSERKSSSRGEQDIAPGLFSVGFLYHGSEKKSDFLAQLSCAGSEWLRVGPENAFMLSGSVKLGAITI